MSKPSTADLIRARLDDNASFQKLEERLEEMAEPGFSAWDLSHEQGVELLKKARRRSKKRKTDDVDDGGTDRIIPAFIDELEKSEKDEEARSDETYGANDIKIDTSKIEVDQEDLAWDAGTDEEIQMHSTAAPGSMPGAACIAIRNLVSKAVTNRIIDLEFVVARCQRFAIGYNPLRFAAATIRMKNPKCTVLIFQTGVILTTGSQEKTGAREATEVALSMLRQVQDDSGYRPYASLRCRKITVHNMVGSTFVNFRLDLHKLKAQNSFVKFDPQAFHGASIRMNQVEEQFKNTGLTVLAFDTGGLVITGASLAYDIRRVYDALFPYLLDCMVNTGLALEHRVSEDRRRRAATDLKRARAAGANSESIIALDASKQDQMLIEMTERNAHSLALVPTQQREMALATVSGVAAPVALSRIDADAHNALAYHTFDESARKQVQLKERLAGEKKRKREGTAPPERVRVIADSELKRLDMGASMF